MNEDEITELLNMYLKYYKNETKDKEFNFFSNIEENGTSNNIMEMMYKNIIEYSEGYDIIKEYKDEDNDKNKGYYCVKIRGIKKYISNSIIGLMIEIIKRKEYDNMNDIEIYEIK